MCASVHAVFVNGCVFFFFFNMVVCVFLFLQNCESLVFLLGIFVFPLSQCSYASLCVCCVFCPFMNVFVIPSPSNSVTTQLRL